MCLIASRIYCYFRYYSLSGSVIEENPRLGGFLFISSYRLTTSGKFSFFCFSTSLCYFLISLKYVFCNWYTVKFLYCNSFYILPLSPYFLVVCFPDFIFSFIFKHIFIIPLSDRSIVVLLSDIL